MFTYGFLKELLGNIMKYIISIGWKEDVEPHAIYSRRILLAFTSPFNNEETILFGIEEKPEEKI